MHTYQGYGGAGENSKDSKSLGFTSLESQSGGQP